MLLLLKTLKSPDETLLEALIVLQMYDPSVLHVVLCCMRARNCVAASGTQLHVYVCAGLLLRAKAPHMFEQSATLCTTATSVVVGLLSAAHM